MIKPDEVKAKLESLGQEHLFKNLSDSDVAKLLDQACQLDDQLPGGLEAYVATARRLLKNSAEGVNPFDGFTPTVPKGEVLTTDSKEFKQNESIGLAEIKHAGFVLVAGGLGERLGYNGIKISLPQYESEREASFIKLYIEHILSLQRSAGEGVQLPLAIMTSDDTHALTVDLLKDNDNFGMAPGQISIMKQNKVPALLDSSARFASKGPTIETKPHGHGDVHILMHQTGTAKQWRDKGIKWVVFFQDTNGIIFRALPAVLGVSASNKFDVNSVCVPRTPGEAVGGICCLRHRDGRELTVNVEYNQLDPLLRTTAEFSNGDVADATGHSPFPGNINCLVLGSSRYCKVLEETRGVVSEFVNPKYADASKTLFKSPTRLECMMQDYPVLLPPDAPVGFTQCDRWLCFSPVKNNIQDAASKASNKLPPECAGTAERDAFSLNACLLRLAGATVPEKGHTATYLGIPLEFPPLVYIMPTFATCLTQVIEHMPSTAKLSMTAKSALYLEGNVDIEGTVEIDGALVVKAGPGAKIVIKSLKVQNKGWKMVEASESEMKGDELSRMRGYKVDKVETKEIVFNGSGTHIVDE